MGWTALTLNVKAGDAEVAAAELHARGCAGLELRDGSHLPIPGTPQPAKDRALIVGYFESSGAARDALAAARQRCAGLTARSAPVRVADWSKSWRKRVRPTQVGRIWVGPPWAALRAPKRGVHLFIEPKMAFGTGDHPTTSLCLAAVDTYLRSHRNCSVLDVGTGTGVLALAARKLGAGRVVAIDNDSTAISLAREYASENSVSGVHWSTVDCHRVRGTFDLVLANIVANTLIDLAPAIVRKTKHRLVLAGVLRPQAREVAQAYSRLGLRAIGRKTRGEWVRLDFAKT